MSRRIAILRGINVGGKRKILMADLRLICESIQLSNIITYIQSGNIVFNCSDKISNTKLASEIENAINEKYGFDVPVIVIKHAELNHILESNPYPIVDEINKHLITFTKEVITEQAKLGLEKLDPSPDAFSISERAIYLHCNSAYHLSKFGNNFFEKKLKTVATTRNLKTCLKLLELSKQD